VYCSTAAEPPLSEVVAPVDEPQTVREGLLNMSAQRPAASGSSQQFVVAV